MKNQSASLLFCLNLVNAAQLASSTSPSTSGLSARHTEHLSLSFCMGSCQAVDVRISPEGLSSSVRREQPRVEEAAETMSAGACFDLWNHPYQTDYGWKYLTRRQTKDKVLGGHAAGAFVFNEDPTALTGNTVFRLETKENNQTGRWRGRKLRECGRLDEEQIRTWQRAGGTGADHTARSGPRCWWREIAEKPWSHSCKQH